MTNAAAGLFVILAYVGIVVLAIPLALFAFLLAPRLESFGAALARVGAVLGVAAVLALVAVAVAVSPGAALWLAAATVAEALVLVAFPLVIGSRLVGRRTGCTPDEALEFVTLGLPVALFASMLLFVVPGGPSRYNIAFLSGPAALLAWSGFVLVVSLGPAVAGVALYRLFERL